LAVVSASDTAGRYGAISRFIRMSLQSFMLALGAYLAMTGKATGGVMIGSSILLGKALAPVELAIAQWRGFEAARLAWRRLETTLKAAPAEPAVRLPLPTRGIEVQGLYLSVSGAAQPILNNINFSLQAGDGLGIIGPSGAGKSTLVRALTGIWPALRGTISFDGSALTQWREEDAGRFLGYLPQSVDLFAGTIAQNIARFDARPIDQDVLDAAADAGIDRLVRGMEGGFDADIGERGSKLSAGQRQRVALARALYRRPFVVIMDEPNSALDAEGEQALLNAIAGIRARGGIAIIVAHRPNVLQTVNKVLVLGDGQQQAFGPRDEVFKRVLNPVAVREAKAGGAA
jgi:ATP-binding cassette subfamily C protein